jgi:hypothetical protein
MLMIPPCVLVIVAVLLLIVDTGSEMCLVGSARRFRLKFLYWPRPIAEVDTFLRDQSLLALKQSNFKRNPRAPPTDRTICALSHFVDLGVCRFTVRRSPTQIRHLLPVLPMHELHLPQGPVLPPPAIYPNHRASI